MASVARGPGALTEELSCLRRACVYMFGWPLRKTRAQRATSRCSSHIRTTTRIV